MVKLVLESTDQTISNDILYIIIIQNSVFIKTQVYQYSNIREFLTNLKQEFSKGDSKTIKVAVLKKVEQRSRMMEKFLQKFKKIVRESEYKERLLVEEFKQEINRIIR